MPLSMSSWRRRSEKFSQTTKRILPVCIYGTTQTITTATHRLLRIVVFNPLWYRFARVRPMMVVAKNQIGWTKANDKPTFPVLERGYLNTKPFLKGRQHRFTFLL